MRGISVVRDFEAAPEHLAGAEVVLDLLLHEVDEVRVLDRERARLIIARFDLRFLQDGARRGDVRLRHAEGLLCCKARS